MTKKVGLFAYQGARDLFAKELSRLGYNCIDIRNAKDISDLDAICMHGGESSVQSQFLDAQNLRPGLIDYATNSGNVVLGVCAGLILLSSYKSNKVSGLGLLDINIERNFDGTQTKSTILYDNTKPLAFIRAPVISYIGDGVKVITRTVDQRPALVKQNNVYGATYHPEIRVSNDNNSDLSDILNL